ncbi:sensor histidine kinase [Oscillatoria acuminata]|uniref:histidine kinase n=1 Tax=Oscillatoria acuminata PCC 6304 TaxID=56110 RepID=K9TFK1_9CYAN|nr:HAMP domain-containing sensor histidine kinase [Oscillatoria acuminata]AFY80774.1 histidine kinase [Oscillatoria acuminata PCC 6304]
MEPLSLGMFLSRSQVPSTSAIPEFSLEETRPLLNPTPSRSQSLAIESVCRQQIQQLIGYLPLVGAWIIYSDFEAEQPRRWVGEARGDRPEFNEEELSYLKSEVWLPDELPVDRLSQLNAYYVYPLPPLAAGGSTEYFPKIDLGRLSDCLSPLIVPPGDRSGSVAQKVPPQNHPSCALAQSRSYLLLWSTESLSPFQVEFVEQQMPMLHHYLRGAVVSNQQSSELQLLRQSLYKAEHQLRNSLALISLYAETLCLGLPTGSFQEQATVIRESVSELSANLTTLLNCGKPAHKLPEQRHDLRQIVEETLKLMQPKLQKKDIKVKASKISVMLPIDRWQIKQVFENLLNNAIAFSPLGSRITCEWQVFYHEVLVSLSDQGPGLSREDLQQAFTPFYTRRPGGTGLGLPIAKKIILDHQGSIWVQNHPESGALFSFTLPRHPQLD